MRGAGRARPGRHHAGRHLGAHGDLAYVSEVTIAQREPGVAADLLSLEGNVIFGVTTPDAPGGDEPWATVDDGHPTVTVPITVQAGRCDPHTLTEYKRTFILAARVQVGDAEPVKVESRRKAPPTMRWPCCSKPASPTAEAAAARATSALRAVERGLEHGGDVVGVGGGGLPPSCTTDISSDEMMATMPLAIATGSMSGRTVPGQLLGAQALGARLAQLGERRDLEHPLGDLGLEPGQQAPGQRVAARPRRRSVKMQRLAPVGRRRVRRTTLVERPRG